jgi:hypothetical protein
VRTSRDATGLFLQSRVSFRWDRQIERLVVTSFKEAGENLGRHFGGAPCSFEGAHQQTDIVSVFVRSLPEGSGLDVPELGAASYQPKTDHARELGN